MRKTLNGSDFLIKDLTVGEEKVLIFTTTSNIKYLAQSNFWLADGTFKTVPTIFRQLYTIHGSIGSNENSRIMPLVYALMSNKSEVAYRALFQGLIDFGYEHDVDLQPQFIITDFEIATINAIRAEFQGVQNKAFDELRAIMPEEANSIMEWFEIYYIRGRIRRTTRSGNIIRSDPLFPPSIWSVTDNIEYTFPRTQNVVEAWHRRWNTLGRGAPCPLQKKKDRERKIRIQTVYNDRDNREVIGFLRGIAHNLSF
ncbi:hypothetical protein RhiirC2_719657 [Rhizophagus irregularis]|uniref:MULE transposase domain-containing protein n=1 Tax=Rhizophagus irregularis TaxID=588596 RepID=A0A2N1MDI4_9GLOM|nr:hypothetical protein RhiirC2_719657 [Rhizophagus irregularis]